MIPLACSVSLHLVQLQTSGGNNLLHEAGDLSSAVTLEPLVIFPENIASGSDGVTRDPVDQSNGLCSLLQRFCKELLLKRARLNGLLSGDGNGSGSGLSVCTSINKSPVAEEGFFIQVPSPRFVSASECSAASSSLIDVVSYNSGHCEEKIEPNDEGYLYGFAYLIDVGAVDCGLLLTVLSTSPLFNTMRAVVLEAASYVAHASRNMAQGSLGNQNRGQASATNKSAYAEVLAPLAELVDASSTASITLPNSKFDLRFGQRSLSLVRPNDMQYPFIDTPMATFFLSFSYNSIRIVHSLLLQEERVIFIGATPQHASACVVSAQSLVVPLLWAAPIVPYLPPEGSGIVESILEGSSFLVGSTAEILPRLMLYGCDPGKGSHTHVWIADARTGFVGVTPDHRRRHLSSIVELVPSSDRLEAAIKAAVSKEQRYMFRQSLGVYVSKLRAAKDGLGKSQLSGAEMQQPTVDPGALEKAHEMIIEYSASRLLGNYRKGMTSGASRNSSVKNRNSNPAAQRSDDVAFSIDYQRFLPDNLGNNANFARLIVNTRMYHNWEYAVLSLETAGLIRSLNGEFVRKQCGSRPQQGRANETAKCCTDSVPVSYYLSHPRMVGLLSDFYIRCARRFTDLFPDLPAAETSRISAALAAKVGGSDTSSSSSSRRSSKGLMRSLFSKATRAVKSTLTSSRQRVTVRVFVQARSSLFNDEKHNDPDRIVKTNKTAQVISSNSPISPQEQALELNCRGIAVPISPGDVEDDPCKASSNAGGSAELDNLSMFESGTKADGAGVSVSCRLLPLDVIHNFGLYHDLLNPTKENAYTTGCQQTTIQCLSVEEAQIFVELARLFVCYNNVWKLIEARRQLLPTGRVEPPQPAVQTLESLPDLWSRDDGGGCSQVVFEAQPLPFPKDLIAGSLELPPLP